jgi:hypothetical protein
MVCDMMCCALRERDNLAIVRLVLFVTGVADCMHSVLHPGRCWLVARAAGQQQPHTGAGIRRSCMGQIASFERGVSCQAVLSPSSCSAY